MAQSYHRRNLESTCWTTIAGAADGNAEARAAFAHRYGPIARDYLGYRWRGSACLQDLDDAVQEFFLECFKPDGVLKRVDPTSAGGFRAFLFGVVRNVALRFEARRPRRHEGQAPEGALADHPDTEASLSRAFDRAWANALLREAARRQAERAQQKGDGAVRRVELLRLRFQDGLPIREIARRWQADAAELHRAYARARREFKEALLEVIAFHHPGSPAEIDEVCASLLAAVG
jgi:RNA polymerase sigma-70 factor (ECF subfamily)